MRATMKTQANTTLYNLNSNYTKLANLQQQLGTGSRLNRMADDPLAANISIQMDTLIARTTQYNRSINTGLSFLGLSDAALGTVKTSVDRARYLTVQAASDTTTNSQRQTMAVELQSILQQIVAEANAYDGSRFIFGGTSTLNSPYEVVANRYVRYTGNSDNINIQVDANSYASINTTGDAAFGRLEGIVKSRDYNPGINMNVGSSTPLSNLNLGEGVPSGSIKVYYGAFAGGVEVDLSGCTTLEDVKDVIERETLRHSQQLKPGDTGFDPDLTDRYLKVDVNPSGNGLLLREADAGLGYTDNKGKFEAGSSAGLTGNDIRVDNVGLNDVAAALGIRGASQSGQIIGTDLNPRLSLKTLLTDLEGYDDSIFTITNGALPGSVSILEKSSDVNAVFNNWNISGLSKGVNTGPDGELYAKVVVNQGSTLTSTKQDSSSLVAAGGKLSSLGPADSDGYVYLHAERLASGELQVTLFSDPGRANALGQGVVPAGSTGTLGVTFSPSTDTLNINVDAIGETAGSNAVVRLDVTDKSSGLVTASDSVSDLKLFGLAESNTGPAGELYIEATRGVDGQVAVKVYRDSAVPHADLVAQGFMGNDGSVELFAVNKSGVNGSLQLDPGLFAKTGDTVHAQYKAGLEGEDEISLELYRVPVNKALGTDLVATATSPVNGTFTLREANNSGITGTVGVNLQPLSQLGTSATVDLEARFDATFRDSIHVPAFKEKSQNDPGADTANLASGWQISGLSQAVLGYAKNDYAEYYAKHATTGPNGELDVEMRAIVDENGLQSGWEMILTRPAFSYNLTEGQPPRQRAVNIEAETLATGKIMFAPQVDANGDIVGYDAVNQGRMELVGVPGHEEISGSVHLEMPAGVNSGDTPSALGSSMATVQDIPLGPDAYEVAAGATLTVPRGATLSAGTVLTVGSTIPKGTVLPAGTKLPAGLAMPDGTVLGADLVLGYDMTVGKDMTLTRDLTLDKDVTVSEAARLAEGSRVSATRVVADGRTGSVEAGTVLHPGAVLTQGSVLSAGTVIDGDSALNGLPAGTTLGSFNVLPAGSTLPAGTVFPKYSRVPPDGHIALHEETLSADVTLAQDFQLDAPIVLTNGLALGPGQKITLANDTVLGDDLAFNEPHQLNASVVAAGGSTWPSVLPAGTVFSKDSVPPANVGLTDGGTAMRMSLEATFATVEDLLNAVNASGTYVTARLDSNGRGIEFVSQLAGAHLVVSEGQEVIQQMGDNYEQLSHLSLNGMVVGENTDPEGNLHAEVVYYDEDVTVRRPGQDPEVIRAGYYVRLYSDRNQTGLDYADRDADKLMASAYVAKDDYVEGMTVNFNAENKSNLSGSVRLDYAFITRADPSDPESEIVSQSNDHSITLYPGGLRQTGSQNVTVSQMDIDGLVSGKNCDYDNQLHAVVTNDGGVTRIQLYSDLSHQHLVASGEVGPNGYTVLKEENGSRLSGSLMVDSSLANPTVPGTVSTESFVITTGGMRNTGHVREENVFATLNDVMDALHANDAETLHDLLGQWSKDLDRLNNARAEVGSRTQRLENIVTRHEEEIISFSTIQSDRIGTRYTDAIVQWQMAQNIYDASLKVTGQFMQLSLLDYL